MTRSDADDPKRPEADDEQPNRKFDRQNLPAVFTDDVFLGMTVRDIGWVREQLRNDPERFEQFDRAYREFSERTAARISKTMRTTQVADESTRRAAERITKDLAGRWQILDSETLRRLQAISEQALEGQLQERSELRARFGTISAATRRALEASQTGGPSGPPPPSKPPTPPGGGSGAEDDDAPDPTFADAVQAVETAFGPMAELMADMVDLGEGQLAILTAQSEANRIESEFGLFISCVFVATLVVTIHDKRTAGEQWLLAAAAALATVGLWWMYRCIRKHRRS